MNGVPHRTSGTSVVDPKAYDQWNSLLKFSVTVSIFNIRNLVLTVFSW